MSAHGRYAAAVAATAIAIAGCGGGSVASGTASSPTPVVSLKLHGGGRTTATMCGATHHVHTYRTGMPVTLSGTVAPIPAGHWKVKLQLKRCLGATATEVAKLAATSDRRAGTFQGRITAPSAGDYAVRAELYLGDGRRIKSTKRHFTTH